MTTQPPPRHPGSAPRADLSATVLVKALATWLLLAPAVWALAPAQSQPSPSPLPAVTMPGKPRAPATQVAAGPSAPVKNTVAVTKPLWTELTASQQQALLPLATPWNSLSQAQKRKWLALSARYPKLPAAEQAILRSRMTEWAALSPQQRTQARLNFGETRRLSPGDKKAQWEAYQALPAEEKRKLAADVAGKTPGTAAAVKPVPAQKLAKVPKAKRDAKIPRIAAGPALDAGSLAAPPGTFLAPPPLPAN